MTDPEMLLENYPGQRTTPDDCPVCHGPIEVEQVVIDGPLDDVRQGRWRCPRGCDPRTLMQGQS